MNFFDQNMHPINTISFTYLTKIDATGQNEGKLNEMEESELTEKYPARNSGGGGNTALEFKRILLIYTID